MSNPWAPPIFTDCSPDCDSVTGARLASGPCAGRVPWTVQCKADPSMVLSPSAGYPIEMRLTMVRSDDPVPGETFCWNGSWISFPAYNTPTVTWAGDIIYLPYKVGYCWIMEARQRGVAGVSETVTCKLCIGKDDSGAQISLDELRFHVYTSEDQEVPMDPDQPGGV